MLFAEHDLVSRLETHTSRSSWHVHGSAIAHDPRPVPTAVVVQPKLSGPRLVRDVRVLTGDALVDLSRSFSECDVIGADEAVATVSHFRASPQVDPVGQERVAAPLGNAASDAELDASRVSNRPLAARRSVRRPCQTRRRIRAPASSSGLARRSRSRRRDRLSDSRQTAAVPRFSPAAAWSPPNTASSRPRASRDGASTAISIRLNGNTRVPRLPGWISRSTMSRIACTISSGSRCARETGEFLRGPIEPRRDLRFEPASLAENVHGQFIFTRPASAAAATISPAAGAALPAP